MKEDIKISSTGGGKSLSTTISYVNPAVNNADLATFGQMLTALTTNIYESTDRVTTVNCDTEEGGGIKPTPTFSISMNTVSIANLNLAGAYQEFNFSTNSDGDASFSFTPAEGQTATYDNVPKMAKAGNQFILYAARTPNNTIPGTFKIQIRKSANYAASEILNFTLTA